MSSYKMTLSSAYADDDNLRPLVVEADFGTGNSTEGCFSFDITAEHFHACTDIPADVLVGFAKWILEQAQEGHQAIVTQNTGAPMVAGCEG